MYKNLQLLSTSIGWCVMPTKWTATKLDNDSNDNGNSPKSSIACSGFHAKLTTLPLSACYSIIPPLFVYLNLNNIVRH
jgi:hypothetical protein